MRETPRGGGVVSWSCRRTFAPGDSGVGRLSWSQRTASNKVGIKWKPSPAVRRCPDADENARGSMRRNRPPFPPPLRPTFFLAASAADGPVPSTGEGSRKGSSTEVVRKGSKRDSVSPFMTRTYESGRLDLNQRPLRPECSARELPVYRLPRTILPLRAISRVRTWSLACTQVATES